MSTPHSSLTAMGEPRGESHILSPVSESPAGAFYRPVRLRATKNVSIDSRPMELKVRWEVTNCKLRKEPLWIAGAQSDRKSQSRSLSLRKSSLTGLKDNIEAFGDCGGLSVAHGHFALASPIRLAILGNKPPYDHRGLEIGKCGTCFIIRLSENICALTEVSSIDFLPFTTPKPNRYLTIDSCFDLSDPLLRKQRFKRSREK